ncbi:reverse transcriptase [Phytophthora megakarya]|uniref:Reverse transcriptase n=1 Tax=Phytophthora megakarya TaxID=4795 RepID=A0A225V093_9STRA|nr:reverse transcriptase [Phytophthora megakarya]
MRHPKWGQSWGVVHILMTSRMGRPPASLYELTDDQVCARRDLSRAKESFEILKIVSTPLLRHPDRTKPFVIIPHAKQWAACAVLGQMHDGLVQPVRLTGRVLSDAELKYHIAEKEVLAVMRVHHVFKNVIEGCPLIIYTRHSVLKWVIKSKTSEGRLVPWGVALSQYDLETRKVIRDEDGLAAIMGVGITPRDHLDEVAEVLIPAKGRVKPPPVVSVEMLSEEYSGVVLNFYGAAKTSTRKGSCGCILWQLPKWKVLDARVYILDGVTVNDAEYFGLLRGLAMALERGIRDIVVVGDSRIVIQQVQGLINCNQPNLQRRLAECETLKKRFRRESWIVQDDLEKQHLEVVSKIREQLVKSSENIDVPVRSGDVVQDPGEEDGNSGTRHGLGPECAPLPSTARVMAVLTRSRPQEADDDEVAPMGPLEFQAERWRRITVHQEEDEYLAEIKAFLNDDLDRFSSTRLKKISKVADLFVLDDRGVLYRLPHSVRGRPRDAMDNLRLVVPSSLREDMLHHAHEHFQGGHQGITRTHEKLRTEFYWPGMYADVQHFVKECVDCASGKGAPPNAGPSPGNIEPRYPFEAVSMDFVTHMPESARGNTFLLLFQDMFSGYVMCKPMSSTTA